MLQSHSLNEDPLDLWYLSLINCAKSGDGQDLLTTSLRHSFDRLHPHFELQERDDFCGIACASILLNTLLPSSKWTQSSIYSTTARKYLTDGIILTDLSSIITACGLSTIIQHSNQERFKEQFLEDIKNPETFLIINYWRQFEWPREGEIYRNGHFSLVAGFNEATEQVLILDTSDSIRPYHWLDLKHLMRMMCTYDQTAAMPRGYLIILDPNQKDK
ncbi:unnamed protein product [Adineta ricciae]|uniref:glutathione gamma-glutamylcysteinyltransferase n=1 Tax=Adineta ricciae TaxID=249248 RepID=A0A813SEQ3_ADIRI|nr:unnamed protein product [Adineta ricciae]CAF1398817.1 unnamed protein product [Adineta ricciae]